MQHRNRTWLEDEGHAFVQVEAGGDGEGEWDSYELVLGDGYNSPISFDLYLDPDDLDAYGAKIEAYLTTLEHIALAILEIATVAQVRGIELGVIADDDTDAQ